MQDSTKYFITKVKNNKVIIIIGAILIIMYSLSSPTEKKPENHNTSTNARVMMWRFVKKNLKSPSTADFGLCKMVKTAKGAWGTDCYVDSQNGFGAMIRTNFYCEVKYKGNESWELVELRIK